MCHLEQCELSEWVTENTKGHDMGREMAFTAEPSVVSCKWVYLLGQGTAQLSSVGVQLWGASPSCPSSDTPHTHRIHGETGSIPVQGTAKLLQLVVNPVTFPGIG